MKNKFGNRYTRAIATFHFHKFVQRFRRTFSLTLSFILLFACFPADARESKKTLQENGNTTLSLPSYVMDGMVLQQNKTTTLNGSAPKSSSGKTISVTLRGGKHKYAGSSTIGKTGKFSIKLPRIKGSLVQYTMEFAIATTVVKTYMMYVWVNFL